jgi:ribosomal protein S18 acetylase RimI-like enzyme
MNFTHRLYQTEDDYWRIREFLRQVFLLNNRRGLSWDVVRLDYCVSHGYLNCHPQRREDVIHLWETSSGQIAAVVLPESPGDIHFQVHPERKSPELETEMLDVAEEQLALVTPDGTRRLTVWSPGADTLRQELLARRGYTKGEDIEYQRRRCLDAPIPDVPLAPGYTVRSLGDGLELLERCYASGLGFHDGDIQVAVDNRSDPTWYRNIQNAPLYRRDLDLVAIAPDGAVAAFCTVWFDDVTRSGVFEPVATVPAHQRRGLGKAVMAEGLRRLRRMGALTASVSGYSPAANALYSSMISPECERNEPWGKRLAISS